MKFMNRERGNTNKNDDFILPETLFSVLYREYALFLASRVIAQPINSVRWNIFKINGVVRGDFTTERLPTTEVEV